MDMRFELSVWRDPDLVSVIRRFIEETYERASVDADAIGRIALTSHELMENAVKYGSSETMHIHIDVERGSTADEVHIRVTNRAEPRNIELLREAFAEIEEARDPFVYYSMLMKRAAKRSEGSGLGLARILAEGEMTLELKCEQDQVCLAAKASLERRAS